MKRTILGLICLLCNAVVFGQDDYYSNHLETSSSVTIPNSPEASSLGRYGNLPLSSATGQMNYSVPLHGINIDGNTWNIGLQYNYSGLLLEGKPSLAGLGWSLPVNGAVTREVRGLPDDHRFGYYGDGGVKTIIDNYVAGGINALTVNQIKDFKSGKYDSEVDKYHVSVQGVSFSFKIDASGNPVYLSKHSHKVTIDWNPSYTHRIDGFVVTDDKGIQYEFTAIEISIPQVDEELNLNPRTSWNLTKVKYLNGQEIVFSYQPDVYSNYNFSAGGSVHSGDIAEDFITAPVFTTPTYGESMVLSTIERQLLDEITFPEGKILFHYTTIDGRKLYDQIEIKNLRNESILVYDFAYQGNRDVLLSIRKNNEGYYSFEYYGVNNDYAGAPEIPEFVNELFSRPLAQDKWKYYNGTTSNTALFGIPNSTYTANKTPSFTHTRLGALKRINYPTGGYTEVNYAQNEIKTSLTDTDTNLASYFENLPHWKNLTVELQTDNDPSVDQNKVSVAYLVCDEPQLAKISHYISGRRWNSHVMMRIRKVDPITHEAVADCPNYYSGHTTYSSYEYYHQAQLLRDYVLPTLSSYPYGDFPIFCPRLDVEFGPDDSATEYSTESHNSGGKILFSEGVYEIKVWTDMNRTSDVYAKININLYKDISETSIANFINSEVGGIRVTSLTDCTNDSEGSQCVSKTFDYNDQDGLSTAQLYVDPQETEIHTYRHRLLDGTDTYREIHVYSSNPYTILNPAHGTPVYYRSVKNYNSIENGYTITSYDLPIDNIGYSYPKIPIGSDLSKAKLTATRVYDSQDNITQKSEQQYQQVRGLYLPTSQDDFNPDHPWSFKLTKKKDLFINFLTNSYPLVPSTPEEIAAIKSLYIARPYKELDSWFKKTKDITETVFEGQSVVQESSYQYNTNQHIKKITTTDSESSELEKQFQYPYDIDDPIYNAMETNNQISNAVTTTVLKDDVIIGRRKTDYIASADGHKPHIIHTATNGDLESRMQINYNTNGKVIEEVALVNGVASTTTSYVWGYGGNYPVAKIVGASYSEVLGTGISLSIIGSPLTTDDAMRVELDKIRQGLPNAQVSTFTYHPSIGITSITDARGQTEYTQYDHQHRVKQKKDEDGAILNQYDYYHRN